MKAKTCEKCGAPLHGYKCEYCGTEYEPEHEQNTAELKQQLINTQFVSSNNAQASSLPTFYGSQMSQCCFSLATQTAQFANVINASSVTMDEARQAFGLLAYRKENK